MTITVTTPDYETDLLTILAAAAPSQLITSGASRNAWIGNERPSVDSGIPQQSSFFGYIATAYDQDNDGPIRIVTVSVLVRGGKNGDSATKTKARAIHDAGSSYGFNNPQFTGASGTRYFNLRAVGLHDVGPNPSSDAYYMSIDFEMSHAG